jgi:hypothetical protein
LHGSAISIIGSHAANPAKRAHGGDQCKGGYFAEVQIFHDDMMTKTHNQSYGKWNFQKLSGQT